MKTLMVTSNKGFTIVELLIVVIVIAILATITIVTYRGITDRALDASLQTDLRSLATVLEIDNQRDGAYPATAAAANNGQGLSVSSDSQVYYTPESNGYCVHVSNQKTGKAYRLRSGGQIEGGVGCKALDAFNTAGFYFARSAVVTQTRTFTMPTAYTSQRWLVGLILRRSQSTVPTVTVDASPVTTSLHTYTGTYGYTWFVAQPIGATTTVEFTGASTASEFGFAMWQVFAPVKPVLDDNAAATGSSPAVVDGYPGGATLASAMYTTTALPGGNVTTSNVGSGAGWYMYAGSAYPGTAGLYTMSIPSESGTAVVVRAG